MPMQTNTLTERGIKIPYPESVYIDKSVDIEKLAAGCTLYPGCRLYGNHTSIGPGCELGTEGSVTLRDCNLGSEVHIASGTVSGAVLLDRVSLGPNVHIRPGTLIEEMASVAHAAGLKQTVLFPYVTLGSLVNFCDILMAGGCCRQNHGEVGSSFVHFNFTPYGDKATASLIGDVPRGVFLNQPPVFLGGQGGLVGPVRVEYGTVLAAGTVCRRDILEQSRLISFPGAPETSCKTFRSDLPRRNFKRIVLNNLYYIGNLRALDAWYTHVRALFLSQTPHGTACLAGAQCQLQNMIEERVARLATAIAKQDSAMTKSPTEDSHHSWKSWLSRHAVDLQARCVSDITPPSGLRSRMAEMANGMSYIDAVNKLSEENRRKATKWLNTIVNRCTSRISS